MSPGFVRCSYQRPAWCRRWRCFRGWDRTIGELAAANPSVVAVERAYLAGFLAKVPGVVERDAGFGAGGFAGGEANVTVDEHLPVARGGAGFDTARIRGRADRAESFVGAYDTRSTTAVDSYPYRPRRIIDLAAHPSGVPVAASGAEVAFVWAASGTAEMVTLPTSLHEARHAAASPTA